MTSDLAGVTIFISAVVSIVVLDDLGLLTNQLMWIILIGGAITYLGVWAHRWQSYKRASGETE